MLCIALAAGSGPAGGIGWAWLCRELAGSICGILGERRWQGVRFDKSSRVDGRGYGCAFFFFFFEGYVHVFCSKVIYFNLDCFKMVSVIRKLPSLLAYSYGGDLLT